MTDSEGRPDASAGDQPAETLTTHKKDRRMSRRTVLKAVGIGGGAVVIAGAAGVGIRGGTNGVWNSGQGAPYELWSTWQEAPGLRKLVAAGALAANPHNIQPWSFVLGERSIDLYADPSRIMPVNDSDGRERTAGYGCAIENITLAARSQGYDARVTPWPFPDGNADHIARIDITPGAPATDREQQLAAAIPTRHSNRGPYTAASIDPAVLASLTEGAPEGAEVVWVTEPGAKSAIGAVYVDATQAIVDDEEMSVESFGWFRNNRSDIDRYRDGLTLDCQGLDGFTLFMAKILPAQSRQDGDAFWVKTTRDVHTATAAAYGVIRVSDTSDPRARLAGGRLLQHLHLAATAAGVALQHMNQVTERIARDKALGAPDAFGTRWADVTGIPSGQTLLAVRVGYPERTPNPSPRRALGDVARDR